MAQSDPAGSAPFLDSYLAAPGRTGRGLFGEITFASIRGILWRQRYVLVIVTALTALLALILTLLMTPVYEAQTTIRYDPPSGATVTGEDLERYVSANEVGAVMRTIAEVAESRTMALAVVEDLGLEDNEALLGDMLRDGQPVGKSDEAWLAERRGAAAAIVQGGVSTDVPYDSRVITLAFRSTDPQLAASIANSLSENLLRQDVARSLETNAFAREFLEEQIADTRIRLQEAEREAIDFARRNAIIGPGIATGEDSDSGEAGTAPTLTASNLARVNQAYGEARADRIRAQERWQAVSGLPAAQLPEVQQNAQVQALAAQLATLRAREAQLRQRYLDDYPDLREVVAEIAETEERKARAEADIRRSIRSAYEVAQRQEAALGRELERSANSALAEQDERVQYNLLERDAQALRFQLSNLLDRYNQIASAANLGTSTISRIDPAIAPGGPVEPNLLRNLLAGLVAGIGLAVGLALLREIFDDRIRSAQDVEQKVGLPIIGQTPYVDPASIADAVEDRFSPVSEAYSAIRATLDFNVLKEGHKVISITSGESGEGKTTTAIALARRFAMVGRKVLLIDTDMRRPRLARLFSGTKPETGLLAVLYGRAALAEALLPHDQTGLDVLPIERIPDNPVEVLSSGLLAELIAAQREHYDLILLDSSPVLGIADAPLISRHADVTLLVIEANRAASGRTRASIRRLREGGARVVGGVLSKFRALDVGEDYSYQYQYYRYGEGGNAR
ncbi:GumC family protein [Erythrobacter sp. EC-HK427]|uniref:GumC family protein n=1 Tax=Erythrobacter sp. EC-HK427 TaxID=2038396 RepID=UPI00125174CC|nr:polysaccharide biosynthesis tyrosine autokinase [Erythrobacter sp. EC-HK427]VVT02350.1 Protein-tyrosine kinase [Erythrobacter sp. EC-HK427]